MPRHRDLRAADRRGVRAGHRRRTEAEHPGHRLRVRLADRSLRQLNPLLGVVGRLLELADSRMEASALLDLCATAPVARKFGFTADDLDRLHDLVAASRGCAGASTRRTGRGSAWTTSGRTPGRPGLDRLLLGVAMDESGQHFIGTALPMDDVDSSDVDLIGRLAECVTRLRHVHRPPSRPAHPVAGWVELFKQALELLTAVPPADRWQIEPRVRRAQPARRAGGEAARRRRCCPCAEVPALLADAFRGRASRANFRTGTLTMCTMLPMRSVPHRVVCLLGVDDGIFPRPTRPDGDDITEPDPWVGDRDPRSEDRQLLLDAIMAAEERLLVIYAGADPRTGAEIPPAVPIGELLDALDLTARTADGRPVRGRRSTVQHPLQPFDPRNFAAGELGAPAVQLRPGRAARRRAAAAAERHRPRRRSTRRRCRGAADAPDWSSWPTCSASSATRSGRCCGTAAGCHLARRRAARRADPGRAGRAGALGGRRPDAPAAPAGPRPGPAPATPSGGAARCRRGCFGARALDRGADEVAEVAGVAGAVPDRRAGAAARSRSSSAAERRLTGTVGPAVRRRPRPGQLLPAVARSIGCRPGSSCWRSPRPTRPRRGGRHHRARGGTLGARAGRPALGGARCWPTWSTCSDTGLREPLRSRRETSAEYARLRSTTGQLDGPRKPRLDRTWDRERDDAYEQFFGAGVSLADLMAERVAAGRRSAATLGEPSRFGTLARRVFTRC